MTEKFKRTPIIAGEMVDAMEGDTRWSIDVHNHGNVSLVDVMPRLIPAGRNVDFAVAQAARTSYGSGLKSASEDEGLLRYLLRHRHTTPFEMVEFKFHCKMPMFVARQWIRHRTASVNEVSGRYSTMPEEYYRPVEVRAQSGSNKQGSDGLVDVGTSEAFLAYLDQTEAAHKSYERLAERGVAREMARIGLSNALYTEWYWKIDLHNLMHFLALRQDKHAQQEIRDYADAMAVFVEELAPVTWKAFNDYHPMRGGLLLTAQEVDLIATGQMKELPGKRELDETRGKLSRLNMKIVDPNPMNDFTNMLSRMTGAVEDKDKEAVSAK